MHSSTLCPTLLLFYIRIKLSKLFKPVYCKIAFLYSTASYICSGFLYSPFLYLRNLKCYDYFSQRSELAEGVVLVLCPPERLLIKLIS
jgi:hypothetical protein